MAQAVRTKLSVGTGEPSQGRHDSVARVLVVASRNVVQAKNASSGEAKFSYVSLSMQTSCPLSAASSSSRFKVVKHGGVVSRFLSPQRRNDSVKPLMKFLYDKIHGHHLVTSAQTAEYSSGSKFVFVRVFQLHGYGSARPIRFR
jgi:hypothetical protein